MATDLTATSGNTASPVVSSASYTFVAGDVNAWVYIQSGTNWTPGWYQIASVSAGNATLSAAVGAAVVNYAPSTVAGCATVASPSAGTFSVDYSQQNAAQFSGTDLVIQATNTQVTSATHTFSKNDVGNTIQITAGTGFTTGIYAIRSVSAGKATLDRAVGTANSTGGTWCEGGALASVGAAANAMTGGNYIAVKSGTYSITSATSNANAGCITLTAGTTSAQTYLVGYGSVRGDNGTKPLLQASGISSFTLLTTANACTVSNIAVDGQSLTSSRGINNSGGTQLVRCKASNCTNTGIVNSNLGLALLCEVTGCSTATALLCNGSACACVSHNNTVTGIQSSTNAICIVACISCNNSGASSSGFLQAVSANVINCVAYNNGGDGYKFTNAVNLPTVINTIATNNGGYGFNASATGAGMMLVNCAGYNNTSGNVNTTNIPAQNNLGFITLTGDPFTNAAGNDFSLNNTAGAGAACRAAGIPGVTGTTYGLPWASTSSYPDLGAAQHQIGNTFTGYSRSRVVGGP